MKLKKIIVSLSLLASAQAMAKPFVLSCELGSDSSKKQDVTFYVDEQEKTVNTNAAVFTESSISFDSKLSSRTVTTRINRITGSLTLISSDEVIATGKCTVATERKF